MRPAYRSSRWVLLLWLTTVAACPRESGDAAPGDGGLDEPAGSLTQCPDSGAAHLDAPCAGDFLCSYPTQCCLGGTMCGAHGYQCRAGSFEYLGYNDACVGQPP